jgi:hypothetical protein
VAGPVSVFSLRLSSGPVVAGLFAVYMPVGSDKPASGGIPLDVSLHQRPPPFFFIPV